MFSKSAFRYLYVFPLLCLVSCSDGKLGQDPPPFPNVVFIFADDMGYGDISALNPESKVKTPNIDELVTKGLSFSNAHASASVCTPSRYGLLTGRYAFRSEHGAYGIGGFTKPVIEPGRRTLANLLKDAGYYTGIVGKWHLGLDWHTNDGKKASLDNATGYSNVDYSRLVATGPNSFGFDYSFIHPASLDIPPYVFLRNHQVVDPDVVLTTNVYPRQRENTAYAWDKKHTDDRAVYWEKGVWWREGEMSGGFRVENCLGTLVDEGVAFIAKHAKESPDMPFFLYLPLTGPHTPWLPSEKNRGKSGAGLYGDFVLDIDDVVGRVREVLEKSGVADNTLLIFSSDNGAYWPDEEMLLYGHDSNAGRRGQEGDIWDGGHRIPLVLSWPDRIEGGKVSTSLVSLTDFYATFAALTGQHVEGGQGDDSNNMLPVLEGSLNHEVRKEMVHHSSKSMYSIRQGGWKYIEGLGSGGFTDPAMVEPGEADPVGQLYREDDDPNERNNLYLQYPEVVRELADKLGSIKQ